MSDIARGPAAFVPKLIFSSRRLEVSTRPDGAVRLDWIGAISTDELDPSEVTRLVEKLTKWQQEAASDTQEAKPDV